MSPPSKRVKPGGGRRTYFFKPEDSLTTNQEEENILPLAQSTGLQNSIEITMTPTRPRKRVSKLTETLRNRKLNGLSSDDMVFWQGTPKSDSISSLSPDRPATHHLPSSPTRQIPISNVVYDPIGELAEKYNTTFDNLASQTPITSTNKVQRRSSDSQPATRKKVGDLFNFEHSPSIRRTKTAGLENLAIGAPGDKIRVTKKFEKLLDEFHQSFSDSPVEVPISSKESTKSPARSASEHDQSGFSDELDLDDINHLLEMTQPKPKVQTATPRTEMPVLKDTVIEEQDSSFDNTSDDNDFEMLFNQLESQNPVKKLSTQEKKIRQSDLESVEIFRRHIKQEHADETKHNTCKENKAKLAVSKRDVFRYQVVKVRKAKYKLDKLKGEQLILTVSDACSAQRNIVIRDFWAELDIEEGDVIHIIGKDPSLTDKKTNILIWNPDLLLSSTLVSESISCKRRSFLKNKLTFPGESSIPLIVGVIVHTVFQQCLATGNITDEFISALIESEVNANLFSIFSINESRETVREKIQEHIPFIKQWHDTYRRGNPVSTSSTTIGGTKDKAMVSTSNILDIEENIWSPVFGLRGLIDVTVEACIRGPGNDGRFVAPLELKTGSREYISHRAQVSLYSLLVRERYDIDSDYFFLFSQS
ncbi:BA75_03021T0 [Komagataella pastoris]|uniref:BA75_03021T0 n=1 Tax=Komagataella pastoris TaxID=4922 RepID=A0A1B2JC42_PICPA|nr:BA75_03021T0 [Komagataella pastoris]